MLFISIIEDPGGTHMEATSIELAFNSCSKRNNFTLFRLYRLADDTLPPRDYRGLLERVMGFEPTTFCLGSKHSTAELHPHHR